MVIVIILVSQEVLVSLHRADVQAGCDKHTGTTLGETITQSIAIWPAVSQVVIKPLGIIVGGILTLASISVPFMLYRGSEQST
jgi:K+-transporting ATPase A subunit